MISWLPTDSLRKVLFFGGIVMMVFAFNADDSRLNAWYQKSEEYKYKKIVLKYDRILDSAEIINIKNRILAFNEKILKDNLNEGVNDSLLSKIKSEELLLFKKTMINNKRDEEINQLSIDINNFSDKIDSDRNGLLLLILFGLLFAFAGYIWWVIKDSNEEISSKRKFQIETKEGDCQSCGIVLKYDIKPFLKKGLCSKCFDGENYREPNLSLADMTKNVETRMNELGIKEKQIKKHIKKLKKLNRWASTLRW